MIPIFGKTTTAFKLFLLLGLLLFGAIFGMLIGLLLTTVFYGLPLETSLLEQEGADGLNIARILQLSGQFGLFIFPPIFYAWLTSQKPLKTLGWNGIGRIETFIFGVLTMYAALPLIHFLGELNSSLHLPESLAAIEQWMIEKEEQAAEMSLRFLKVTTISGLLFNLFMIAIIPAIGEELVFRGALQPLLIRLTKSAHIGIISASLLFGLMHLQFYGLFPRVVLGLFLGYYFYYSGSLWVPVIMHFVNNGTAVIVYYLHFNGYIETEMENFGSFESLWPVALSFVMVMAGLIVAQRVSFKHAMFRQ